LRARENAARSGLVAIVRIEGAHLGYLGVEHAREFLHHGILPRRLLKLRWWRSRLTGMSASWRRIRGWRL
jgi:hypothetical protein